MSVIDKFNREGLRIEIDAVTRLIQTLNGSVEMHGAPLSIRLGNGPESFAYVLAPWAQSKGIVLWYIQPGKSTHRLILLHALAVIVFLDAVVDRASRMESIVSPPQVTIRAL